MLKKLLNLRGEQGPKYDTLSSTGGRHSAEYSQRGMPFWTKQKSHKNRIAMKLYDDLLGK